mmetsp:Transcript_13278/g.43260  ORF Transcript_13278/g.43260 Transcript_13278/m.43260 type:complete len:264 (-) Transcript_13278:84-875(-)|eukprot:CAMPEP_0118888932 /NCGR_PEP_ID=MMETSP1166-20130328/96_1 /TAXON_ID=1104430 /ORGANISM="Chrysoreinhardia sp, Strain CCMP3193" /LENGTH=263 /DNA_ID=CAMNT_0006827509 /DNA_START=43 /DNA_END=834 /DNA_ORIENTATION=+
MGVRGGGGGATVQTVLGSEKFSVDVVPADGDCFYTAMSHALSDRDVITVRTLRERVSQAVDGETLACFKVAYDAGVAGFEFMRRCKDLPSVRARLAKTSEDVGVGQCVWANDFEIRTTATLSRCAILIWDMEARQQKNAFLYFQPESSAPVRFVMLQRTRREHYNLITFESRLRGDTWPPPLPISQIWNIRPAIATRPSTQTETRRSLIEAEHLRHLKRQRRQLLKDNTSSSSRPPQKKEASSPMALRASTKRQRTPNNGKKA